MKTECSKCKYYRYSEVPGSPYEYRWKCTKQGGKWFQRIGQPETIVSTHLECFEPRHVPSWRVPVAVFVGIWVTVFLFIAIYFLGVGFHLANMGDFRPVNIVVPIIVGIIAIAVGTFGGVWWYKRRL